jgi:hypothetical protein
VLAGTQTGGAGSNYGGAGAGGYAQNLASSSAAGGNGANGIVYITEYNSQ